MVVDIYRDEIKGKKKKFEVLNINITEEKGKLEVPYPYRAMRYIFRMATLGYIHQTYRNKENNFLNLINVLLNSIGLLRRYYFYIVMGFSLENWNFFPFNSWASQKA